MTRLHASVVAFVASAAVIGLCAPTAFACTGSGFTVGDQLNPTLATPTFNADETYGRYSAAQVRTHFADQSSSPPLRFGNSRASSFSCVDARGDGELLGTPGGDLAELVSAIIAWFKLEQKPVNKADIKTLFDAFMDRIARRGRPLYFHTDDSRLRQMFAALKKAGVEPQPSKLPDMVATDAAVANTWLEHLIKPEFQGCGHIRLMLGAATAPFYSVKLNGSEVANCMDVPAANCISSAEVAAEVITLFYKYYWFTPAGSEQRQKVKLVVDLGPLVGKAVTIVSASNGNGTCRFQHPLIFPNKAGSTLFVYHDAAVKEFRDMAVRVAQTTTTGKRARLLALWNGVAGLQLGSTLTYLAPANDIGIFPVTINSVPGAAAGS